LNRTRYIDSDAMISQMRIDRGSASTPLTAILVNRFRLLPFHRKSLGEIVLAMLRHSVSLSRNTRYLSWSLAEIQTRFPGVGTATLRASFTWRERRRINRFLARYHLVLKTGNQPLLTGERLFLPGCSRVPFQYAQPELRLEIHLTARTAS